MKIKNPAGGSYKINILINDGNKLLVVQTWNMSDLESVSSKDR